MAYSPSKVAWSGLANNMFIFSKFIPNFGQHSSQQVKELWHVSLLSLTVIISNIYTVWENCFRVVVQITQKCEMDITTRRIEYSWHVTCYCFYRENLLSQINLYIPWYRQMGELWTLFEFACSLYLTCNMVPEMDGSISRVLICIMIFSILRLYGIKFSMN